MASLTESVYEKKGCTVLYIPDLSNIEEPAQAAKDKNLVQKMEATLIHWTR